MQFDRFRVISKMPQGAGTPRQEGRLDMAKRYTYRELMDFVCRADSLDKVETARVFIDKLDYISNETYDDLMMALSYLSRELYREA